MHSQLLNLPAEIREQIYREILSTANCYVDPVGSEEPGSYKYDLAILLVNHQIYREAKKIFQDNIFVKITTPWPEAIEHIRSEGRVPTVATGSHAATFRDFHLWVFIDTPATPHPHPHVGFSMLICLEDLKAFTKMWHFSNLNHLGLNKHLRLKLTIQDPHVPDRKIPKTLQSRLLLPFGMIKDLHEFTVQGAKVLPSVEEALKNDREIPDPSPEQCLERGFALKETGNALLTNGSYREALEKYFESYGAIHITVTGRVRMIHADGFYIRELTSGLHKNMRGDYVRMILRGKHNLAMLVQLVANIVLAYMKLENWIEAHFWGKRSVILFRQSVTGDESDDINSPDTQDWYNQHWSQQFPAHNAMGKIFYRTAVASRVLGKNADVLTLLKAAHRFLPNDENVQRDLKGMMGGMGSNCPGNSSASMVLGQ